MEISFAIATIEKLVNLLEAIKMDINQVISKYHGIQEYIKKQDEAGRIIVKNSGFVEHLPEDNSGNFVVVGFSGRAATPSLPEGGIHMAVADASRNGCSAVIVSAHNKSREEVLPWLEDKQDKRLIIMGHSHGGDHASLCAAEYFKKTGRQVHILITIDPLNSPWPFPLSHIALPQSVEIHKNYFQRYWFPFRPWYGGNIPEASTNENVTTWNAWTRGFDIASAKAGTSQPRPPRIIKGINHTTIDEDLFLHGVLGLG